MTTAQSRQETKQRILKQAFCEPRIGSSILKRTGSFRGHPEVVSSRVGAIALTGEKSWPLPGRNQQIRRILHPQGDNRLNQKPHSVDNTFLLTLQPHTTCLLTSSLSLLLLLPFTHACQCDRSCTDNVEYSTLLARKHQACVLEVGPSFSKKPSLPDLHSTTFSAPRPIS